MPAAPRASQIRRGAIDRARTPVALYRPAAERKSGASAGRRKVIGTAAEGPDLAARLRGLQRTLRPRVERREALLDMVRTVNATCEPPRIAEALVERAQTWVPAPIWAVVLTDLSGRLSVLASRGLTAEVTHSVHAIAGWVIQHGGEFASADLRRDARLRAHITASVVAFPLACRGRRMGALVGLDPAPSARDPQLAPAVRRAVGELLEPASAALDNALLLERAEGLSVTDDLTQLYNSRYLNQVLRRETKRASRSGRPLSLLFIDLDGFKAINDTHGHLFGSRALVEAAAVIRGSARETDVVARFGGDEFALVLPDTGCEGAYSVGERTRERIAAFTFLAGEGLNIRLTASVGVATLPDAAASADELVQAADKAMYQVKDSGKNGIQVAAAQADT